MGVGRVDAVQSLKLNKRLERKYNNGSTPSTSAGTPSSSTTTQMVQETDCSDDDNLTFDKEYKPTTSASNSSQMRLKLTNAAMFAQRYNISHRGAAAFGSALLEDMGFISETDRTRIIDKNKISREKRRGKELKVAAQKDNNGHLTGNTFKKL